MSEIPPQRRTATVAEVDWTTFEFPRVHFMTADSREDPYDELRMTAKQMARKYPDGNMMSFHVGLSVEAALATVVGSEVNTNVYPEGIGDGGKDVPVPNGLPPDDSAVHTWELDPSFAQVKGADRMDKFWSRKIDVGELRKVDYLVVGRTPLPPTWAELLGWQDTEVLLNKDISRGSIEVTLADLNVWEDGGIYGIEDVMKVLS